MDKGLIRYVNQTHLVLARGKWILQKNSCIIFSWTLSLDLKLRKLSMCQSQKMRLLSNNERSWTHFRVFVVRKANWSGNGQTLRNWQLPQIDARDKSSRDYHTLGIIGQKCWVRFALVNIKYLSKPQWKEPLEAHIHPIIKNSFSMWNCSFRWMCLRPLISVHSGFRASSLHCFI